MEKNALHIWPRHSFMLIALPNTDGSFTCTLFLAHQGTPSFAQLRQPDDVVAFFNTYFPDVLPLMPTLTTDFFSNPESSLVTVKCSPWVMNRVALIGDAAHAIVPFYGQGMNCGFEDCRILMDCLEYTSGNLETALPLYEEFRKPDADAIADLAVENFIEMRDKVADKHFLQRKKLEAYLYERFPDRFIPQYTMVTFAPDVPYSEARRVARENDVLLDMLVSHPVLQTDWETNEVQALLQQTVGTRKPIAFKPIGPL